MLKKRYLIMALLVLSGLLWIQTVRLRDERAEHRRVQSNNEVLTDSVEFYRTASGKHAASRQVLELRASELERYNAQLAATVRELRIKARRLEAAAMTATRTEVQITAPLEPASPQSSAWEKYGAKGRRFGKSRPRSEILRTAESPRSEGFQVVGPPCERGRDDPGRFGELPRRKHRHAPAGRPPGSAAVPIYPMGD